MLYHDCIMFFSIVNMINHDYIHAYHPMAAVGEVHDDAGCGGARMRRVLCKTWRRSFSKYNTLYLMLFCVSYPCNKIDVSGQFAGRIEKTDIGPKSSLP